MLDYAVKLTAAPSSVNESDIKNLCSHGFDDRDILDIVYVICLYNFNDRMADATGIKGHDFLRVELQRAQKAKNDLTSSA